MAKVRDRNMLWFEKFRDLIVGKYFPCPFEKPGDNWRKGETGRNYQMELLHRSDDFQKEYLENSQKDGRSANFPDGFQLRQQR